MSEVLLRATGLTKTYVQGGREITVLKDLGFEVRSGEKLAIVGRSGSGKSTLLHVLAGLDTPEAGVVMIDGQDMIAASANERARLRGLCMGFVYQNHHLLGEFTALENVAMAMRINGVDKSAALTEAGLLLEQVDLAERKDHLPSELSGGERQRVAVARALAGHAKLILADEPTGNLDSDNAQQVMNLLHRLCREHGSAIIVVTHDQTQLDAFDRVLLLSEGSLTELARDEP